MNLMLQSDLMFTYTEMDGINHSVFDRVLGGSGTHARKTDMLTTHLTRT